MKQSISSFTLHVSDERIRDLWARMQRAVIPQELPDAHGWPGSIVEFLEVIAPLTAPVTGAGPAPPVFDQHDCPLD